MNIFKYLLPWIALLFFITTGVHANDSDKKKNYDKDGKKYHQKKWDKKGKMMWGKKRGQGGAFAMIEAQGKLFLYNKKTGDVWVCNAFKKTCEQMIVENKDIDYTIVFNNSLLQKSCKNIDFLTRSFARSYL